MLGRAGCRSAAPARARLGKEAAARAWGAAGPDNAVLVRQCECRGVRPSRPRQCDEQPLHGVPPPLLYKPGDESYTRAV